MPDKAFRAIRRFCMDCQGGHAPSVISCKDGDCFFYALRLPPKESVVSKERAAGKEARQAEEQAALLPPASPPLSVVSARSERAAQDGHDGPDTQSMQAGQSEDRPLRVIRRYCLLCSGSRAEARECDAKDSCALWSFRFGVLPSTFKRVVARRKRQRVELSLPGLLLS
ncbi:hypothetical protein LJC46_02445 [Desulfovibrio sp. OttesenSCG-928-G15]|nr:hypothetical protein [Desulfovibrio sp. OttesenSCG-928-G15]